MPGMQSPPVANEWLPTLVGASLRVRPIKAEDFEGLYRVASDPVLWSLHSEPNRYERPVFQKFFDKMVDPPVALVVVDRSGDQIIGSSRYYDYNSEEKSVVIGYTFLEQKYWGGPTNLELKRLMLDYAFKRIDTVIFHTSEGNLRSQKAITKLGAVRSSGLIELAGVGTRVEFRLTKERWHAKITQN